MVTNRDRVRDPRRVRSRRYRLGSLLTLCLVAVLGGATSLAAIARFAANTDCDLCERLGLAAGTPNASTLERLLARLDGDALDDAVGACRDRSRPATTDQARTLLHRPDTAPCQICRPDRPVKGAS